MVWQHVVDGPLLRDVPADLVTAGAVRDQDGRPLTGIFRRAAGDGELKAILSNGHARWVWEYPKIDLVFGSPLVNDVNLYCCREGWAWEGDAGPMTSDLFSVERVAAGLKPFGVCLLPVGEPFQPVIERCSAGIEEYGLAVQPRQFTETNQYEVTLSRREPFTELFDLSAFTEDWRRLLDASPRSSRTEEQLDQAMGALRRRSVHDFMLGYDYKNPPSLAHMMIVGLLFGYPLETTAGVFFSPPDGSPAG